MPILRLHRRIPNTGPLMFTGIVSRLGQVESIAKKNPTIVRIACPDGGAPDRIGASVACAGICLTATSVDAQRGWFEATLSDETLAVTTAGEWLEGRPINLERPLRLGDELGGHLVGRPCGRRGRTGP